MVSCSLTDTSEIFEAFVLSTGVLWGDGRTRCFEAMPESKSDRLPPKEEKLATKAPDPHANELESVGFALPALLSNCRSSSSGMDTNEEKLSQPRLLEYVESKVGG